MQASTILHEFGHNAWRRHGGDAFAPNCQPLYLSSMNYLYQLRGLLNDAGKPHLDLSRAIFAPAIDETALTDNAAWPVPYRIGWYAPLAGSYLEILGTPATRHCDGTPLLPTDAPTVRFDAISATGGIDWMGNGSFESGFALDVNFNGRTTKVDGVTPDILGSSDDWSQVLLNQVGARRSPGALYLDQLGNLSFGPLSLDAGRGDLGRGDLGRGDLGRGDLGRGDLGRGDLGRGDLGRGDLGRGDLGTLALGRGDLGRGDLGGGDLFQNDPNNPFGELDFETATDLARTPPNEFSACVIGVDCTQQSTPFHRVRLDWKLPNIGSVGSYNVYRAADDELLPNQDRVLVGQVVSVSGQIDYTLVDDDELIDGAFYTYYVVAIYTDGVQSDHSNPFTILAVNAPAAAVGDEYSTAEDTPLMVAAPGVLANDGDPDSGGPATITATLVSGASHGTVALQANGSFTYTPTANFNGSDAFTYQATVNGIDTNVATVAITVTSVNDVPTAAADSYSVAEDTPLTVAAPGVLGNDTDDEGPLSAVLVSGPAHGTLSLNANGSFTFTPAANYSGADGFTYRTSDGDAVSGVATVSITVTPVNDAPVAIADSYSVTQGSALNVAAPGVLANDSDIDGALSAWLVSGPSNGTITLNANGAFSYTPAATFYGSDSFVYRASDGTLSTSATVTITVNRQVYGFIGVQNLPPSGSKMFTRGSAIPLRWQFTLEGVVYNSVNANPQVVIVSSTGAVVYGGTPSDPGSSSFQPPTASNGYTWQFNWQTTGLAAGTYRIYVGSEQTGQIYPSAAFGPFEVRLK
jgi:VCBS repeat-containing protein